MGKKRKKKKKPLPGSELPQGQMRPTDDESGRQGDDGTRVDDGARHIFFSFKGELKSDQPDVTETDFVGDLGLPEPDEHEIEERDEAAGDEPGESIAPDADATVTELDAPAPDATKSQEQTGAGPVRGQDPAATKSASQSRKAAGPAQFTSEQARAPDEGARATPDADDSTDADAGVPTQTDVRGGPFVDPYDSAAATQPEIEAAGLQPPAEPEAAAPDETHTDVRAEAVRPKAPRRPREPVQLDDESVADDETIHDAAEALRPPEPAGRPEVGDETILDAADALRPVAPAEPPAAETTPEPVAGMDTPTRTEDGATGTVADAEGAPFHDATTATPPDAKLADRAGEPSFHDATTATPPDAKIAGPADERTRTASDPAFHEATTQTPPDAKIGPAPVRPTSPADADTTTKEPARAKDPGATETDMFRAEDDVVDVSADEPAVQRVDDSVTADVPAAPSMADADTASLVDPFDVIAAEAAEAEPESPFRAFAQMEPDTATHPGPSVMPSGETVTQPAPDVTESAPARLPGFHAPLFDAPAPAVEAEPAVESRPAPVRRRSRRGRSRRESQPLSTRVVRWAKHHLDPRDFLEIVGTAIFERAKGVAQSFRKARRESRISHSAEWWRRTLVELAILYAIVIPIELAVTQGRLGSFGVHPHPYWLIVLPMAAARGLVAGLIAAVIASILFTIGAAQAVTGDILFSLRNMTEPILSFAAAFFAGDLHDEAALKRRKLERRLDDLDERTKQLRQQRDVLTDANRELEKRIVDDSVQFGNLIQAARRIERAGRQEIFEFALEMVEEHCGAAASVLLRLEDGSLDYLCHRGWPGEQLGSRLAVARESAFVQRAIAGGLPINGLDPAEVAPPEGPLVVAPLFDAQGVVKALMCLDDIPLARLNESTVTVFLGIADWASTALSRLTQAAEAPTSRRTAFGVGPEVDIWLGNVEELGKRLRVELARCSRYGVATSFLAVHAPEWTDVTQDGIDALDRFILAHFTTGLRPSDSVYRFGYPGCYLMVLAGTDIPGAEVVRQRLLRRLAYSPAGRIGAIEIEATGPDTEAPDLVSLTARVARHFRDRSQLALDARCPVTIPDRLEAEDLNAFLRRLKMETSLAVRNDFDLHVVGISAEASEDAGPGILARHVVEVGAQTLRPTDGVYMIGQYQCAVILPSTSGEEAATVAHRLATLVRARDPNAAYGAIETQVLGLGAHHPDAGSFLTALALRSREGRR